MMCFIHLQTTRLLSLNGEAHVLFAICQCDVYFSAWHCGNNGHIELGQIAILIEKICFSIFPKNYCQRHESITNYANIRIVENGIQLEG